MILIVMGVSGSGKTTVGMQLANKLGWKFLDADDYHPEENKEKMAKRIPLNDQDRVPWLCTLHEEIIREASSGQNVILACSALKKAYRKILACGASGSEPYIGHSWGEEMLPSKHILFVYLNGSMEVVSTRLEGRREHFMPITLLQSQYDTLEPPEEPENFITVNVEKGVAEIIADIVPFTE
ncbi:probable gluconokinase [Latimeria chalumnae]|uniref:Gluconokinase n=1 Tax=Latimeria chalumnae TaxID=7897 RepID=H3A3A7_LATCH|nr:PREDICTED: probable gluconokinase isoform X2 [Latimeria chalumnae]|eukprot:XP_006011919.1 PREDICTED: probable gluconokinase isoform X2 [Latimeria chalumnae]